jgi:hypothetical protein
MTYRYPLPYESEAETAARIAREDEAATALEQRLDELKRQDRESTRNAWGIGLLILFFLVILVMAGIEQFPNFIRYIRDIWYWP